MYENNRDSFGRRHFDDDHRNDEPAARWRRGEDRYRREAQGAYGEPSRGRFDDDDRFDRGRNRDFGYGRAYRDDDYGGRGSFGRAAERREQRSFYGSRDDEQPVHWHDYDREHRAGHPYQGTYGGTGDSSYFTGQQGSWAVGAPRTVGTYYGTTPYGADYRRHGHDERDERGFWDRASDEVASWFGDEDAARRREQDHRGRGPKDYIRSDERIREDANDKLTEDWRVDASDITVKVANGEVTLDGTVASREAKRRAEDLVDGISGVKHVQNNLRVQQTTGTYGNWTQNRSSTAEGGVASQSATEAAKQNKV
jgi:osmotically-inducible protein OsmY